MPEIYLLSHRCFSQEGHHGGGVKVGLGEEEIIKGTSGGPKCTIPVPMQAVGHLIPNAYW